MRSCCNGNPSDSRTVLFAVSNPLHEPLTVYTGSRACCVSGPMGCSLGCRIQSLFRTLIINWSLLYCTPATDCRDTTGARCKFRIDGSCATTSTCRNIILSITYYHSHISLFMNRQSSSAECSLTVGPSSAHSCDSLTVGEQLR